VSARAGLLSTGHRENDDWQEIHNYLAKNIPHSELVGLEQLSLRRSRVKALFHISTILTDVVQWYSSRQVVGQYLKIGNGHFQFIINKTSYYSMPRSTCNWKSVLKLCQESSSQVYMLCSLVAIQSNVTASKISTFPFCLQVKGKVVLVLN